MNYMPKPKDTSKVKLDNINYLIDVLAENVHDVWALSRVNDGWKFGKEKDESKKEDPCLVPFKDLTENEKTNDRNAVIETLKLMKVLGYDIVRSVDM